MRRALDRALGRLPVTQRIVVVRHWLEERSLVEVAKELGISHGAAKVRAHRAYRALRSLLAETEDREGAPRSRRPPHDVREGGPS